VRSSRDRHRSRNLPAGTQRLAIVNFPALAGSDAPVIALLPVLLPAALIAGFIAAAVIKRRDPEKYARLADDIERTTLESEAETEVETPRSPEPQKELQ
jgi:hypothetical protein